MLRLAGYKSVNRHIIMLDYFIVAQNLENLGFIVVKNNKNNADLYKLY